MISVLLYAFQLILSAAEVISIEGDATVKMSEAYGGVREEANVA